MGYSDDFKIRPFIIIIPKTSTHIKIYDDLNKNSSKQSRGKSNYRQL